MAFTVISDPLPILREPADPEHIVPGQFLVFANPNWGSWRDRHVAGLHLRVGSVYQVERISMEAWTTDIWLRGLPGIRFNLISFSLPWWKGAEQRSQLPAVLASP